MKHELLMRCNICYLDIQFDQKAIKCPRCLNDFHQDHLAAWLLSEKSCPICREVLSDNFRESLRPKSDRERQRLQDISRSLNSIGKELERWERRNQRKLRRMREVQHNEPKVPIPWGKIFIPLLLFLIWVIILIAIFG